MAISMNTINSSRATIFSPCRKYRYTLWRQFYAQAINPPLLPIEGNQAHNYAQFIGLNPSTADETLDDPTIRRCVGFAKAWGYGAICMTNLFAWRDTSPAAMKLVDNPVGEDNQHHLLNCASGAGLIVAAWGKDGAHMNQDLSVRQQLVQIGAVIHHLGLNLDGTPKHPLYLKSTTKPTRWA